MKAIQITKPGVITLINLPPSPIQSDEVLIKVRFAGFCGSDLNTYSGKNALAKMPVIPGHEIGGVIEAVGEKVSASLIPGMSCAINPYTACGNCSSCQNGRPNACRHNQTLGIQRDGAMREYMAVPWQKIITDTAISPKEFCLVEPISVGFHAIDRGKVTINNIVMVLGCGMIGIGAIVSAALRGAKVIAVDIDESKLSLAKQFGATFTINTQTENIHDRLQEITCDFGPDVIIEAVGSPTTYQMAVNEAAFSGRVVCIGYAKEQIAFETKLFVQKELDIRGSRNAMPEDFRAVIECMKQKIFPIEKLISDIFNPEQVKDVFKRWTTEPVGIFRLLIEFN